MVAWVLIIVGAINWGLVGGFGFNLVNWIFSFSEVVETIVYILVGVSGVYAVFTGCHGKK
ncbi:DUF378 domain-containing protein [Candidatus Uhrbacteria bacterium CG10_big_fil_rev_8_21_14_0_10_50_16]|uniref:DUF378 domain-containing protein n=1 Tax=Candidatus Uhrbacteria bacterium CG10_big_fil_rev_8_21_14_0_10_50_16 TaxID=1975039 RepID=A0A2H0RNB7_9BACT|nr:MAG: DUF378 domain-containing protein [Candidatus Uhrbacteria bacterium CG10_big_fil_rev_8_21_14_0_10_50_16]